MSPDAHRDEMAAPEHPQGILLEFAGSAVGEWLAVEEAETIFDMPYLVGYSS